jgi:hypothetical protein
MATEAQIAANRNNAQASTGATTAAGKARSSRNALSSGLFSRGDFVLPDEQAQYAEFCASFQTNLEPEGPIEQTLSAEIIHAAWRMRRCSAVAAGLIGSLDPMVDPAAAQTQQAVDRARNDAHRAFQRSISELRRLQTERQFRNESFPDDFDPATLGIASFKDMAPALMIDTQRQLLLQKLRTSLPNRDGHGAAPNSSGELNAENNSQPKQLFAIRTQSGVGQTPRNSPCACGSGLKFKRCCGKGAPAILNLAA